MTAVSEYRRADWPLHMRILQLYNQYRSLFGGEETVVRRISHLVEKNGGEARLLIRSSRGLDESFSGKARAFLSGIYNPIAPREVSRAVQSFRPDIAHIHNLYPLFSPSVLVALKRAGVPVVMTVHNHFHTCPTADHFRNGDVCELCADGRVYHCFLQNCRGSLLESFGYALRSQTARTLGLFTKNVTVTIALNEFARERLLRAGFDESRVVVVPNMIDIPLEPTVAAEGRYAVFSGRMCPEKGTEILLEASRLLPDIPIRLLGAGPTFERCKRQAPVNATFLGQVPKPEVDEAYRGARFLVVPSRWFEGCPLVILEGMSHGLPVVASRIGGLPELVEDGVTGLLFETGNAKQLAGRMRLLWDNPSMCARLGEAARQKAICEFSEHVFWQRLSAIYEQAIGSVR